MALSRYTGDTDYISQLSDQPNDNDGLDPAELKAKFDQFGTEFVEYFNETLLPEIETAINAAASGIPTGGADASILLDNTITNSKLKNTAGSEAVNTNVIRDGAVTGDKLEASVKSAVDAVAGKASFTTITVTLDKDDWSNSIQTVTATGVTAENTVIATAAPDDTSFSAWSNSGVYVAVQALNSLTFKCRSTPTSDVNVNILILN